MGESFDTRLQIIAGPEQIDAHGARGVAHIAAQGGATLVQWRCKSAAIRAQLETAAALRTACAGAGIPLIVNDRVDIALATACAGAHLGQDDMPLTAAREILGPEAVIGVTVRSVEDLRRTPVQLADYVSIGGVFATTSKSDAGDPIGLDGVADLARSIRGRFNGPVIAISGIGLDTAASVLNAGADGIAVISAVWSDPDPAVALGTLRGVIDTHPRTRRST